MKRRVFLTLCLSAGLIAIANPSAPQTSGPEQAASLERKIDLINGLMSQRQLAARILNDLSKALPGRVWLTEVIYDSEGIQVKGNALSNNLLADCVSRLEGNPDLTEVNLLSSVQRRARNNEYQEFALRALVKDTRGEKPSKPGSKSAPGAVIALTKRLEELEKVMPARKETGDILRQLQQAANDSRLKISKFAPGSEMPREFYSEWPISIEVTGTRHDLRRFFDRIADLPRLWLIKKFSFNAISNQDADSSVRASFTAQTCILRETPAARVGR
jgi:hypothetical protein